MDLIKTTVKGEFVILFFFPFLTAILDNYITALSDQLWGKWCEGTLFLQLSYTSKIR